MEARAIGRLLRISPTKARQVINLIRGKPLEQALNILEFTPKKAAKLIKKVVLSARANAENNYDLDAANLFVAQAYVDEGPILRRYRAVARGQAHMIRKRTAHITVVLQEKEPKRKRGGK